MDERSTSVATGTRGPTFWLLAGCLACLGAAAYSNSLHGPFILDDVLSLIEDTSVRDWATALKPPANLTISGRPVLALSLVLNYKLGGLDVVGYHLLNTVIHVGASLFLFSLVARTLELPSATKTQQRDARLIGFVAAALWLCHPLCTQAVTYTIQRGESLMAFFYLGTLWAHARGVASRRPWLWHSFSMIFCILGMGTKEVMVSAPVAVLLYDRAFVSGTFREALRQRWRVFAGLAVGWVLLAHLILSLGGNRGGTTGASQPGMWPAYWLTQAPAIATYLKLTFWPVNQALDYGPFWIAHAFDVWPEIVLVAALFAGACWACFWRPKAGFPAWFFFAILAPTSVMAGALQMIAEHRAYLALTGIVVLVTAGLHRLWGKRALWALCGLVVAAAVMTHRRNRDYRTDLSIWSDTVSKRPQSYMARNNLGLALLKIPGREAEAATQFREALLLDPSLERPRLNLALTLLKLSGKRYEGIAILRQLVKIDPEDDRARQNLGIALSTEPATAAEAVQHWREVLKRHPKWAETHAALGAALVRQESTLVEGIQHLKTAVELEPGNIDTRSNLALALSTLPGQELEAVRHARIATECRPEAPVVWFNLGSLLQKIPGSRTDALEAFERACSLAPDNVGYRYGHALCLLEDPATAPDGISILEGVIQNEPTHHDAYVALAIACSQRQEGHAKAVDYFRHASRLRPGSPDDHFNLAMALAQEPAGREEAIKELEACIHIQPSDTAAASALKELRGH